MISVAEKELKFARNARSRFYWLFHNRSICLFENIIKMVKNFRYILCGEKKKILSDLKKYIVKEKLKKYENGIIKTININRIDNFYYLIVGKDFIFNIQKNKE